jgi:hypothetical protein
MIISYDSLRVNPGRVVMSEYTLDLLIGGLIIVIVIAAILAVPGVIALGAIVWVVRWLGGGTKKAQEGNSPPEPNPSRGFVTGPPSAPSTRPFDHMPMTEFQENAATPRTGEVR